MLISRFVDSRDHNDYIFVFRFLKLESLFLECFNLIFFSLAVVAFLPVCCCSFSLLLVETAHNMRLVTKESRLAWETDFSSVIIVPVIKVRDDVNVLLLSFHFWPILTLFFVFYD